MASGMGKRGPIRGNMTLGMELPKQPLVVLAGPREGSLGVLIARDVCVRCSPIHVGDHNPAGCCLLYY